MRGIRMLPLSRLPAFHAGRSSHGRAAVAPARISVRWRSMSHRAPHRHGRARRFARQARSSARLPGFHSVPPGAPEPPTAPPDAPHPATRCGHAAGPLAALTLIPAASPPRPPRQPPRADAPGARFGNPFDAPESMLRANRNRRAKHRASGTPRGVPESHPRACRRPGRCRRQVLSSSLPALPRSSARSSLPHLCSLVAPAGSLDPAPLRRPEVCITSAWRGAELRETDAPQVRPKGKAKPQSTVERSATRTSRREPFKKPLRADVACRSRRTPTPARNARAAIALFGRIEPAPCSQPGSPPSTTPPRNTPCTGRGRVPAIEPAHEIRTIARAG